MKVEVGDQGEGRKGRGGGQSSGWWGKGTGLWERRGRLR
jgi:hypothetical protein